MIWRAPVLTWSVSALNEMRRRARNMPMDITARLVGKSVDRVQQLLQESSVKNLRLMGGLLIIKDLLNAIDTPAPELRTMLLSNDSTTTLQDDSSTLDIAEALFDGCTPSLRILHLYSCNLSWEQPAFSSLTQLKISFEDQDDNLVGYRDLMKLFEHSPNLQRLDLTSVADVDTPFSTEALEDKSPPLHFVHLKSIRLEDDLSCMVAILRRLDVPSNALISLYASWDQARWPEKHQLEELFNYLATCPHITSSQQLHSLSFKADSNYVEIQTKTIPGHNNQFIFQMMLDEDDSYADLPTLAWVFKVASRNLPLKGLRELYIGDMVYNHRHQDVLEKFGEEQGSDRFSYPDLLWLFQQLDNLNTLRIGHGAVGPCLAVLCVPDNKDLLPQLKCNVVRRSDLSFPFEDNCDFLPHLEHSYKWDHGCASWLDMVYLFVEERRTAERPLNRAILAGCRLALDPDLKIDVMVQNLFGDEAYLVVSGPHMTVDPYDSDGSDEGTLEL
jgi:hypothetical protein